MSKMLKTKIVSMTALLGAWTCSAVGLDGSSVDLAAYYPDSSSVYEDGGVTTVSGSDVYTFPSYAPGWTVAVTDNQLIVTAGYTSTFTPATFNGWVLTDLSGPGILSAVTDASSQFDPVGITIAGDDQLFLNYQDVPIVLGQTSVIDINSSSAPDGGLTVAMLGSAMVGLGLIRQRL
jgi:hypothetical protein